ncbi:outer membrane beta-barrel protein [uncultured Porphyromonas sp.]|uniref:outer membrane beta-barrel protein n=1 Tax=uncultured Porphyromonas sp. TaxID=159274 RepID=UPI00266D453C|nr:outer membrane beta-barrel protein [uncultured Porphyromonas sp.]
MTRLRTLLLSLVALCALGGTAQAQMPLRIYVDAAPLFNLSHAKTIQDVSENKVFVGYRLGAGLDVNVGKMMYIGTGLTFAMKGNQYTFLSPKGEGDIKVYSHYMQIPVNVGVRLNLTPTIGASVEAGPYFAYALGATVSQGKILDDIQKTYNVYKDGILGMDGAKLKRYDIGLGAKAKVTFGSWYGMVGADMGFVDELKLDEKNDPKLEKLGQKAMRNTSFYLGAGFTF